VTTDHGMEQRGVENGAGARAGLVERRRERYQP